MKFAHERNTRAHSIKAIVTDNTELDKHLNHINHGRSESWVGAVGLIDYVGTRANLSQFWLRPQKRTNRNSVRTLTTFEL